MNTRGTRHLRESAEPGVAGAGRGGRAGAAPTVRYDSTSALPLPLLLLLQLDAPAIKALHDRGFSVAVETNGTQPAPLGLDWICVSPKAGSEMVLRTGHELKLVYPQTHTDGDPARYEQLDFTHFFLQPMDAKDPEATRANTAAAIAYCLAHPAWRLSMQTHKAAGIR